MKNKKRLSLEELMLLIDGPNQQKCFTVLEKYRDRIFKAPGSLTKHQAWEGGYVDHLEETMNFAVMLHRIMNAERRLPFTISDAIIVLFWHDFEKPFGYVEPKTLFEFPNDKKVFIEKLIKTHDIELTSDHWNGLEYIHGEGHDYHRTEKRQGPLSAFCHICDTVSARIWYDYPEK